MSAQGEAIRARLQKRAKKVTVPEWGEEGSPLELYFFPLTVNDAKKLNSYIKGKGGDSREDEYVYFIIFNALNAQGDPAFDLSDAEWLGNQSINLIVDIYLSANDRKGFNETLKK